MFRETTTEVPFRCRVGKTLGAQGVEVDRIGAPQFDMLDPLSTSQDVERDVQDVVGFMIGTMPFQDMKLVIDVAGQADPSRQQQHGTDAAGAKAMDPITEFIMDVAGRDHRLFAFDSRLIFDAVEDLSATFAQSPTVVITGRSPSALGCFPW